MSKIKTSSTSASSVAKASSEAAKARRAAATKAPEIQIQARALFHSTAGSVHETFEEAVDTSVDLDKYSSSLHLIENSDLELVGTQKNNLAEFIVNHEDEIKKIFSNGESLRRKLMKAGVKV